MIRIGNAQAFWGDRSSAPTELLQQEPDLDYLTLDYLAELSLGIMALQREKDPSAGYAKDFLKVIQSLIPLWKQGHPCKLITNAGGLNPEGCAQAVSSLLQKEMAHPPKVLTVTGDDINPLMDKTPEDPLFCHLETGRPLTEVLQNIKSANAYLGAHPIADALSQGAQIVITGRVADPSLVLGPALFHYGWSSEEWDRLAGATVAGHLIECGTQVTGGCSTNWLSWTDHAQIGYPIAEVAADGSCVITKPKGTSGGVTIETVKEQLLYEIADPACYLSPDVTVSFLSLKLEEIGKDRIRVSCAKGAPPPSTYKVSATYQTGFRSEGTLAFFGENLREKAEQCGQLILQRLHARGLAPKRHLIECLGLGDLVPGVSPTIQPLEAVLRIAVADPRKEVCAAFTEELAPLVTCGPQGTTGYSSGRPKVRPFFAHWPCLVAKERIFPEVRS